MPSFWDYIHIGRSTSTARHRDCDDNDDDADEFDDPSHNLQEGLFQIATQTCSILVQVNNTNNISFGDNSTNIQYNNFGTNHNSNIDHDDEIHDDYRSSVSTTLIEREQRIVLIPPSSSSMVTGTSKGAIPKTRTISTTASATSSTVISKMNYSHRSVTESHRRPSIILNPRKFFSDYKNRLSTVLEGSNQPAEDDFELWDQSQMFRSENGYRWNHGAWCKPSCIPITVILTLIVLVVLLPLLEHANEKAFHMKVNGSHYLCIDTCRIELVESIPEGLNFPNNDTIKFLSTFNAWQQLIDITKETLDIGSFYWTLRGSDVYNHTSAWEGEQIFQQILLAGTQRNIKIRIAQSSPTQQQPNLDTEFLVRRKAAEVRSINFPRLLGGGVLHTKLWISDGQHFYLGSANMDWRSLTQVKELGIFVQNCTCLAKDVAKIFNAYWFLGRNNSHIPNYWPEEYSTKFNENSPLNVNFNDKYEFKTYFSSSPPPLTPRGRTNDVDAIVHTILNAEKYVHIAVMDYFPLTIYTPKMKYWPYIDDAIRKAAIENKVSVKLLISWWNHSRSSEDYFLRSLKILSNSYKGVDIQVKRFIVPSTDDQARIPFGRVNHNKYMVTDNTAYIGTSNWSGDYFTDTAGIGLILRDSNFDRPTNETTIRNDLSNVFYRDWHSPYAVELMDE